VGVWDSAGLRIMLRAAAGNRTGHIESDNQELGVLWVCDEFGGYMNVLKPVDSQL